MLARIMLMPPAAPPIRSALPMAKARSCIQNATDSGINPVVNNGSTVANRYVRTDILRLQCAYGARYFHITPNRMLRCP